MKHRLSITKTLNRLRYREEAKVLRAKADVLLQQTEMHVKRLADQITPGDWNAAMKPAKYTKKMENPKAKDMEDDMEEEEEEPTSRL